MNRPIFLFVLGASIVSILLTGCTVTGRPRVRPASYASATASVNFQNLDDLGRHSYRSFAGEHNGVVYTCRGGHIDLSHLRIAADNVFYFTQIVRKHLKAGDTDFTYKLNVDPSIFRVHIDYPANFKTLPSDRRDMIIDDISLELAQYFTWNMISWHEVLTWFGFKTVGFISEFPSAFSWEDPYSNLLGTRIGAEATKDAGKSISKFDTAMTADLKRELQHLDIRSAMFAHDAAAKMEGKWYKGYFHTDMLLRNLDLGYDDGYVTPVLVPGACPGVQPQNYPIPIPKLTKSYGFTVSLQIEPHEFERSRYLKIIYPEGEYGPVIPLIHMPIILTYIRTQAIEKGYTVVP